MYTLLFIGAIILTAFYINHKVNKIADSLNPYNFTIDK